MSLTQLGELFQGFSKLSREERFQRLMTMGALTREDVIFLKQGGIHDFNLADHWIENVIGYFQLPLGVATNLCIDDRDYVIPMAVEETSIIAALSKTARWVRQQGRIETAIQGESIVGQIQLASVKNPVQAMQCVEQHKAALIKKANEEVIMTMVKRGGGVKDLTVRCLPREDGCTMVVIHLYMDSCDAMGANLINQVLEHLKTPIEQLTQERVAMCILSNLNDQKLTHATVTINQVPDDLGQRLQEASLFAEMDPYRAATHNKGIMNGMDPVLIATGNDWRAVEAGVHAYAAREGRYRAISTWRYADGVLKGELIAPIIVGIVGGVTSLHPMAQISLKMMRIESANHLSRVIAAVGLLQNLGALRALCTEGIIQGHMKLHIDNLMMVAGAREEERPLLKHQLQQWLHIHKRVSLHHATEFLSNIRLKRVVV